MKYDSPIEDIFENGQNPEGDNAFLLLGHRGCFLVVADEAVQQEIVRFYKLGTVGIYDY